jgi:hypothetical protein
MQKRNEWFKQWKISKTADMYAKYEKFRKETKRKLSTDKRKWLEAEFREMNVPQFWRSVRKLTKGKSTGSEVPELTEGLTKATTAEEKADMLRDKYERPWSCITHNHQEPAKESGPLETGECTEKWGYSELRKLNTRKAAGPDGIPRIFLKQLASVMSAPLALLINKTWQEGILPSEWKQSIITPVPKAGKSNSPGDYRPIQLTCIMAKIAERFVLEQIEDAIDHELLHQQFGFRKQRGTQEALIQAEYHAVEGMEACASITRVALVSFDISKAFDSVSHQRLMDHLRWSVSLSLNARRWLHDFVV